MSKNSHHKSHLWLKQKIRKANAVVLPPERLLLPPGQSMIDSIWISARISEKLDFVIASIISSSVNYWQNSVTLFDGRALKMNVC